MPSPRVGQPDGAASRSRRVTVRHHCECSAAINGQAMVPRLAQQSATSRLSADSMRRRSRSFDRTSSSFSSA